MSNLWKSEENPSCDRCFRVTRQCPEFQSHCVKKITRFENVSFIPRIDQQTRVARFRSIWTESGNSVNKPEWPNLVWTVEFEWSLVRCSRERCFLRQLRLYAKDDGAGRRRSNSTQCWKDPLRRRNGVHFQLVGRHSFRRAQESISNWYEFSLVA